MLSRTQGMFCPRVFNLWLVKSKNPWAQMAISVTLPAGVVGEIPIPSLYIYPYMVQPSCVDHMYGTSYFVEEETGDRFRATCSSFV